ncbi:unnamed protein product, partial [Meganyctiphanes norvegica]
MPEYLTLNTMEAAAAKHAHDTAGGHKDEIAESLLSAVNSGHPDYIIAKDLRTKLQRDGAKYDLDHLYSDAKVKGTLLHYVAKKNLPKVAELLIENGANPNSRDLSGKKFCPLHCAAEKGNAQVIQKLLDCGANPNVTESGQGHTALHLLSEKWRPKDNNNEDEFKECLDILLRNQKININIQNKEKSSPIFRAATRGWEYMVQQLILNGADLQKNGRDNVTDKEYIYAKLPGLLEAIDISQLVTERPRQFYSELKTCMNLLDINKFNTILTEINDLEKLSIIDSEEDQNMTLLQYACDNGLTDFVEKLLTNNANPIKVDKTNFYTPILYASEKGYHKTLDAINKMGKLHQGLKQTDKRQETSIHKVVKQINKKEGTDYKKCLEILLQYNDQDKTYLDIDATDKYGNTPLHHAALHENQNCAKLLLLNGAHLGIKNDLGILAITNIKASILEDVLDNSITLNNGVENDINDLEVVLNYSAFAPNEGSQEPETECLKFLSSSYTHRHLLRHPIINTFLSLKWQKISKYYTFNLIAYIVYLILLTSYILIYHGRIIEQDASAQAIYINKTTESKPDQNQLSDIRALKVALQLIITLITVCIGIKEFIQLILSWNSYVTSFKNWLEISIVIMTVVLLFVPLSSSVQHSLSAWIVLFSWTIFILILGCHPSLAIYITMFRRVTHNFTKFIFLFSFMILAFSLSFYLIFQVDENFMTIPRTILKTIAMSTGELEYTDLPFTEFPVTSQILFVLFILFILMVIMNLINGLAVSDIHMIQQEAEIYSYKNRVELISYLESVFLTDISFFRLESCISFQKWFGPRTLLMLPCLKNHSIKMYPNRIQNKKSTNKK